MEIESKQLCFRVVHILQDPVIGFWQGSQLEILGPNKGALP